MRMIMGLLCLLLLAPAISAAQGPQSDLGKGDWLRQGGEYDEALAVYRSALAQGAPKGEAHHRIGQCLEALGRYREAADEYAAALAAEPGNGEIREDLEGIRRRRGLTLRADLGGTEPGTSRQAFEGVVRYGGLDHLELQGGYAYSDQVYFQSNRGFVTAYRFYGSPGSYVKGDLTLRKYDYPINPSVLRPTPDSNAYDWVPRGEVELLHSFGGPLRMGLAYQLYPANFFYDTSAWSVNQKLSAELEVRPAEPLRLRLIGALLRDPDPRRTEILGRTSPVSGAIAAQTNVVYRTTSLLGGAAALALGRATLELEYLPNRDLDNGYAWSLLSTLDLRVAPWLDVRLQEVHDAYSSVSNYPGRTAEIYMAAGVFKLSDAARLRGGFRYVDAPTRRGGTALVGFEWRTGLL